MNSARTSSPIRLSPLAAGLASLILPGLGQVLSGELKRGFAVFFTVASALATTIWFGRAGWYLLPAAIWAWNIWDARRQPKGAPLLPVLLLWLAVAFGIGWQVTEIDPRALIENSQRSASILRPMLNPDFLTRRATSEQYWVQVQVPCVGQPPRAEREQDGVRISASQDCAAIGEILLITAEGLRPDYPTDVTWVTPTGGVLMLGENNSRMLTVQSSETGSVAAAIQVPSQATSDPDTPLRHRIFLTQTETLSGYSISTNGRYVLQGIYETLALALLATTLGAILALPISFLAARNLMSGNPITYTIYLVVRTALNFLRSIEALILAIIFVIIVGLGPFPGMLAITLHTVAALGKLYSEVIEGIDPGPIEAIRATGANWAQVVRYGVIPQIIPPFTALTIFRWDINVRSSTIIGFVGGGGIGFFLYQWILLGDYRAVSASFIAIAIVVIVLDFFSARLREQLH